MMKAAQGMEARGPGVELRGRWTLLVAPGRARMVPEVVVVRSAGLAGPRWGVLPLGK